MFAINIIYRTFIFPTIISSHDTLSYWLCFKLNSSYIELLAITNWFKLPLSSQDHQGLQVTSTINNFSIDVPYLFLISNIITDHMCCLHPLIFYSSSRLSNDSCLTWCKNKKSTSFWTRYVKPSTSLSIKSSHYNLYFLWNLQPFQHQTSLPSLGLAHINHEQRNFSF